MSRRRNSIALLVVLANLTACAGYMTGKEVGIGFDAMNTISPEQEENEKWWKSYYGKCHSLWSSTCEDEEKDKAGGGGGGMWTGGVGPSDSGSSSSSSGF
jgi:hypothetical protein